MYRDLFVFMVKKAVNKGPLWHMFYGLILSAIGILMVVVKPVYLLPVLLADIVPALNGLAGFTNYLIPQWMNTMSGCIIIFSGAAYAAYWFCEWYITLGQKKI